MFPCCQYCYVKFRNDDGSINHEALKEWAISELKEKTQTKQAPEFSEIEKLMVKCIDGACSCHCHVVGSRVLH
ncbi:unnamed protein product [marine sediment metagenome]|uniref:Uncharacterized protein n=1 Tax=marine sediment metagenome TaxID=412755 RepID=X1AIZ6_9ZZZZ